MDSENGPGIEKGENSSFEEEFLWKLELSLSLNLFLSGGSALAALPPFAAVIP